MKKCLCLILAIVLLCALCVPVLAATDTQGKTGDTGKTLLVCFAIGAGIGLIVVLIMKGKLKSVRAHSGADAYIAGNDLQLTRSDDVFLYQTVTRHAKPQNDKK